MLGLRCLSFVLAKVRYKVIQKTFNDATFWNLFSKKKHFRTPFFEFGSAKAMFFRLFRGTQAIKVRECRPKIFQAVDVQSLVLHEIPSYLMKGVHTEVKS